MTRNETGSKNQYEVEFLSIFRDPFSTSEDENVGAIDTEICILNFYRPGVHKMLQSVIIRRANVSCFDISPWVEKFGNLSVM